ncbi:MAG: hypothetical protein ACHQZR_04595 [Candidatus Limnocylindrales bacterium]
MSQDPPRADPPRADPPRADPPRADPPAAAPPTATANADEPAEAPRAEARRTVLIPLAEATASTNGHASANGNGHAKASAAPMTSLSLGATRVSFEVSADSPSCADCGSIMVRNGSCYKCLNCGSTSGCS